MRKACIQKNIWSFELIFGRIRKDGWGPCKYESLSFHLIAQVLLSKTRTILCQSTTTKEWLLTFFLYQWTPTNFNSQINHHITTVFHHPPHRLNKAHNTDWSDQFVVESDLNALCSTLCFHFYHCCKVNEATNVTPPSQKTKLGQVILP